MGQFLAGNPHIKWFNGNFTMVSGFLIFPTKPIQRIKDSIDSRNIWDFLAAI